MNRMQQIAFKGSYLNAQEEVIWPGMLVSKHTNLLIFEHPRKKNLIKGE